MWLTIVLVPSLCGEEGEDGIDGGCRRNVSEGLGTADEHEKIEEIIDPEIHDLFTDLFSISIMIEKR